MIERTSVLNINYQYIGGYGHKQLQLLNIGLQIIATASDTVILCYSASFFFIRADSKGQNVETLKCILKKNHVSFKMLQWHTTDVFITLWSVCCRLNTSICTLYILSIVRFLLDSPITHIVLQTFMV